MKKIFLLFTLCSLLFSFSVRADDECRTSIFSTSTDWEAVSGMYLKEYRVIFGADKTFGNIGTELYFLDGFPCYGQTDRVRAWVAPTNIYNIDTKAYMMITCLAYPKEIKIAYREAASQKFQGRTKSILTCKTERSGNDVLVKLQTCERTDWQDYK